MFEKVLKIVKKILPKAKEKIQKSASEIEAKLNSSGKEISPRLSNLLNNKINQLEPNLIYQIFLGQNLSQALEYWQENSHAPNHLVISAIPVEPLANIIKKTLNKLVFDQKLEINLIKNIPREFNEENLSKYLNEVINKIKDNNQKQLIIIPDLSNFFLRSVKGLEIIDFLLITIGEDSKNFWLIGCYNWLWLYLQKVSKIDTYLENKKHLPDLTPQELKQWLNPIFENFKFDWISSEDIEKQTENDNSDAEKWQSKAEKKFFQTLASACCGSSYIAGELWLNSLSVIEVDLEKDKERKKQKIVAKLPICPDIPTIQQADRQLLSAIGCHSQISIKNLAFILAEEQVKIKAEVYKLIKLKLINYQQGLLTLNPLVYPKLISDLQDNNLLIDL